VLGGRSRVQDLPPPSLSLGRADRAPPRTPMHKRETRSARDISPHARPPKGPAPLQNRLRKGGREFVPPLVPPCEKRSTEAVDAARKRGSTAREAPSQESKAKRRTTSEGAVPQRKLRARKAWGTAFRLRKPFARRGEPFPFAAERPRAPAGAVFGGSGAAPLSARPSGAKEEPASCSNFLLLRI